ncbi:CapA family protein [Legionella sp.]|uniref:CapA family protein n=1 Tax=Legionella sp. TaxID=459 RepID=UPI003CC0806A
MSGKSPLRIFLSGDVMTGRGIDQILTHPTEPKIYESYIQDARDYVFLAERINGKIPRFIHGDYLWNDALKELDRRQPDVSLINLETSVTSDGIPCLSKGIQYRMHPENIDAITAARINVCSLANNHILDWGINGFCETLETLNKERIAHAGAGQNIQQAQAPGILSTPKIAGKILIFSMGTSTSGIPKDWGATATQAGVWLLNDLGTQTIKQIKKTIECYKQPGDFCIISIHWGGNWVDQIPLHHQTFAHELIDTIGVNLIHGHSSHHPIGIELYKDTPILYGCGDLINDYEGITNYKEFHNNLSLMYFLEFDIPDLKFKQLELISFERKKFKLNYANKERCQELLNALQKQSISFNTHFKLRKNVIYL